MDKPLTAQQLASQRQREKRKSQPRLPTQYLSEDESELMAHLVEIYGSIAEVNRAGWQALRKNHFS